MVFIDCYVTIFSDFLKNLLLVFENWQCYLWFLTRFIFYLVHVSHNGLSLIKITWYTPNSSFTTPWPCYKDYQHNINKSSTYKIYAPTNRILVKGFRLIFIITNVFIVTLIVESGKTQGHCQQMKLYLDSGGRRLKVKVPHIKLMCLLTDAEVKVQIIYNLSKGKTHFSMLYCKHVI